MGDPVKHVFRTGTSEVWAWGEAGALVSDKPLVLVIGGAFAIPRPRLFELQDWLPEAAVLAAHLPGNHSPNVAVHTVAAYAKLFDDVVRQVARPAVVVGDSVGGLVALSMRERLIEAFALLEPPLVTGKLWPLIPTFQGWLKARPREAYLRLFLRGVFGVRERSVESLDYGHLVDGLDRPAWALMGDEPLMPPRPFESMPSLLDEPERERLRAHPMVQVRSIEGIGHNVGGRGIMFVRTAVRDLLQRDLTGATIKPGMEAS